MNTHSGSFLHRIFLLILLLLAAQVAASYETRYIDRSIIGIWDDSGKAIGKAIISDGKLLFYTKDSSYIGYKSPIDGVGNVFDSEGDYLARVNSGIEEAVIILFGAESRNRQYSNRESRASNTAVIMFEGHSTSTLEFSLSNSKYYKVADDWGSRWVYAFEIPSGINTLKLRYGSRPHFGTWEVDFNSNTFYNIVNVEGGQLRLRENRTFDRIEDLGFTSNVNVVRIR